MQVQSFAGRLGAKQDLDGAGLELLLDRFLGGLDPLDAVPLFPAAAGIAGDGAAIDFVQLVAQIIHGVGVLREDDDLAALLEDAPEIVDQLVGFGIAATQCLQVENEAVQVVELFQEIGFLSRRQLDRGVGAKDIEPFLLQFFQFVQIGRVFHGEGFGVAELAAQPVATPLQTAPGGIEAAGEPAPVDGHDEAQPFAFGFVLAIEVADVLGHAGVEFGFLGLEVDALDLRLAARHLLGDDAARDVFTQQVACIARNIAAQRRVAACKLAHVVLHGGRQLAHRLRTLPRLAGQVADQIGMSRADRADHRRIELAVDRGVAVAVLKIVLDQVKDKVPVGVGDRLAQFAEEVEKIVFVGTPATAETQHRQQIPDFDRVHLHGRRREQDQTLVAASFLEAVEQGEQAIGAVLGLQEVLAPRMVRLVDDEQIPGRGAGQLRHAVAALGQMARRQQQGVIVPRIVRRRANGLIVDAEQQALVVAEEAQVELLVEFFLPLFEHGGRRQHQTALHAAAEDELAQDEAGFDRLAQTHFIAEHDAIGIAAQKRVGDLALMGPEGDGAGGGAQPCRAEQIGRVAQKLEADAVGPGCFAGKRLVALDERSGRCRFQRVEFRRMGRRAADQFLLNGVG